MCAVLDSVCYIFLNKLDGSIYERRLRDIGRFSH